MNILRNELGNAIEDKLSSTMQAGVVKCRAKFILTQLLNVILYCMLLYVTITPLICRVSGQAGVDSNH